MGAFSAFADVLSYPGENILAVVDGCMSAARVARVGQDSDLALGLAAFRSEAERLGVRDLEEAYTRAFDLGPGSCLYVGHHVFGETPRRSLFMARLAAMYREAGGPETLGELPDHLPLVLRYLDANLETIESRDLLADAVVPALGQILAALDRAAHPYTPVVRSLLAYARASASEPTATGASV